jgi:hypothetical protein
MNAVSRRGLVRAGSGYVVFELVEGSMADGDFLNGDFDSHGPCSWTNVSSGGVVRVYVQRVATTFEAAQRYYVGLSSAN